MKKIDKIFSKTKAMSLDLYLEKVLYDKNIGYYQRKNPFGLKGDYVTAPNISNLFCEMITIWLISFWKNLKKPKKLNFIELGPGNGDFCLTLLKTLKNFPEAYSAINIMLYEKSERLKKIQQKRIISKKVSWIKNLKKIRKNPVIFFGNEFLDALPIKQFKKMNGHIYERYVALKKNKVDFVFKKAVKKQVNKLKDYKLLDKNGIIEYPEHGFKELEIICRKIKKLNGGALFIDYGYNSGKNINTLQSVIKHRYNNINKNIGDADITTLVNFGLYREYFNYNGLLVEDIISQSKFLQKMGIIERVKIVSNKMTYEDRLNLYMRLKRLIDPKMMGKNFKVIFTKNKKCKFSLAFK
jgi:cyclopropane-fatty-acyl-phospholipid synthase